MTKYSWPAVVRLAKLCTRELFDKCISRDRIKLINFNNIFSYNVEIHVDDIRYIEHKKNSRSRRIYFQSSHDREKGRHIVKGRRRDREGYKKTRSFHGMLGAPFRRQPCKCEKHVIPRVHGTPAAREGYSKDQSRGEVRKRRRDGTMVACLTPRLTRTVYCSSPKALGTSLARIAARGFPRSGKIRRGRG